MVLDWDEWWANILRNLTRARHKASSCMCWWPHFSNRHSQLHLCIICPAWWSAETWRKTSVSWIEKSTKEEDFLLSLLHQPGFWRQSLKQASCVLIICGPRIAPRIWPRSCGTWLGTMYFLACHLALRLSSHRTSRDQFCLCSLCEGVHTFTWTMKFARAQAKYTRHKLQRICIVCKLPISLGNLSTLWPPWQREWFLLDSQHSPSKCHVTWPKSERLSALIRKCACWARFEQYSDRRRNQVSFSHSPNTLDFWEGSLGSYSSSWRCCVAHPLQRKGCQTAQQSQSNCHLLTRHLAP